MSVRKVFLSIGILIASLALLGAFVATQEESYDTCAAASLRDGCTVIMVGKDASVDGSVMTTHTCDCGFCDWTWRYIPAADYKPGKIRKIYHIEQLTTYPPEEGLKWDLIKKDETGLEIPQVPHTYAYIHGAFGYMNDHQLALGESTIGCHKKMENPTPSAKFDITMLTLIVMERCKTAREAIKLMGSLSEKHGYGHTDTAEMLALADPNELWLFEIMPVGPLWTPESGKPGALWCAQRVPDDHVSVCPNESRIGEIDLDNPDYFMASPNAVSFAVEQGYYDPESGEPFNWKKAYSPSEFSAASTNGSRGRLWRFFSVVAPSQNFSPETPNMELPFSVKPDKKISLKEVMDMTRDKFEGTPYYSAKGLQGGPFVNPNRIPYGFDLEGKHYDTARVTGVNRAEYVTITQCRSWLPPPIGGIVWLAFGAQDTSCYFPLYQGITKIPNSFEIGDHWVFDRNSARWAFDYVDYHTQVLYSLAIHDVRKVQAQWEDAAMNKIQEIDQEALELHKQDPAFASKFLTDYCLKHAENVIKAWWELGDQLLVRYNKLWIYDTKTRKRIKLEYPEWWLKELIQYNQLKPRPEKEKKE